MKFHVVRKLNSDKSRLVDQIIDRLLKVTLAMGWEETQEHDLSLDLMIVIGGDGTMLHAMARAADHVAKPVVVGVNIGKLGFLAEIDPSMVQDFVIGFVNECYQVDSRTLLEGSLSDDDGGLGLKHRAINEFVIAPTLSRGTIKYEFFINDVSAGSHHANGLIIATPTGSTAYSLSVGGAIIQPHAPVFQIVPIAPMSLNSRSVIVGDDVDIKVRVSSVSKCELELIADGQVVIDDVVTPPEFNDIRFEFNFRKADRKVKLVHMDDWNFFRVLQQKLHWSTQI